MPHRKDGARRQARTAFWPRAKTLSRLNSLRAAEILLSPARRGTAPARREEVARCEASYTGQYLKTVLK